MATAASASKKTKYVNAGEKNRAAIIGAGEPILTVDNYETDLAYAFSYYNNYSDEKDRRKWVVKYLGKDKESIAKLSDVSDFDLRQIAILIRLSERGQALKHAHTELVNEKLKQCFNDVAAKNVEICASVSAKPVVTIADRLEAIASTHIGDIEAELDNFIINRKSDFSMKEYIAAKQINGPTAKIIAKWFTKTRDEVAEAIGGDDKQLVEGYSHLSAAQLKRFHKLIASIVDECVQAKVKIVRKARKVKIKPPTEVVKRVKYLPEFSDDTLTLKSEHPVKLVNSTEIWLYNVKSRRATVLKAVDNDVLVVKGTSIVNFDTSKSETRTLRKPEEFFKTKLTKRELGAAWKALKTKSTPAKGRISEDTVIIAAII